MAGGATRVVFDFERRAGRDFLRDRGLDQVDVAVIFADGGFDEDRIGIAEVRLHLIEQARHLLHAREDVPDAHVVRRVILRERQEERIADQLHWDGRVVAIILNLVEFEQAEPDLVVDKLPFGGVLRVERRGRRLGAEALAPVRVEGALRSHRLQAHVVKLGIECDRLAGFRVDVRVVAG